VRWGDYSDEVRDHTNLYWAENRSGYEASTDDDPGAYFPVMREKFAREVGPGKRKLGFNVGANDPKNLVRKSLAELVPYADSLAAVSVADEPAWTVSELSARAASVRAEMASLGLSAPVGVVLHAGQMDLAGAEVDWVGVECYLRAPGPSSPEAAADEMRRVCSALAAEVPAGKRVVFVGQGYSRNGAWTNVETLRAVQRPVLDVAMGEPRALAVVYFAWGRPSGVRYYPELRAEHESIWGFLGR
jgi:hypothetical protein